MNYVALGLCFDIAGTWCLAYEIVFGYAKRNRGVLAQNRYYDLENHVRSMIDHFHTLPDDAYDAAEKKQLIEQMRKKWEPDLVAKRDAMNLGSHHHWSFLWAFLGAVFLTIGFTLQLTAAAG